MRTPCLHVVLLAAALLSYSAAAQEGEAAAGGNEVYIEPSEDSFPAEAEPASAPQDDTNTIGDAPADTSASATAVEAPPVSADAISPQAPSGDGYLLSGATFNGIKLQVLDKVTARISMLEGVLGSAMRFGNLDIVARVCWQAAPTERPENAALLDISESKPGQSPQQIFSGWMFSSSPALSALEHPVYDITVIACTNNTGDAN